MKKNIALDLDNTVFDAEPIYKMGFKCFPEYKYFRPPVWSVYECYPKEVADKIIEYFKTKPGYSTKPFDPAYSFLIYDWRQKHNVKVITSRTTNEPDCYFFGDIVRKKVSMARLWSYEQLFNNHMYIPMDNIIDINKYTKLEAIKKEKIDLVIDDSPLVIEECLENNIDCVMLSNAKTPYNHYLRSKSLWAKNLFDVAKIKGL